MNKRFAGRLTRRLFILFALVACLALLNGGQQKTEAFGCYQFCANAANACMSGCNGDPVCEDQCKADFYCCNLLCEGRGDECP